MHARLTLVSIAFLLSFLALIARLFFWQIIQGRILSAQARDQYKEGATLLAPRGSILASDGSWLAARVEGWLVFAEPSKLEEGISEVADKLAPFFVEDPSEKDALVAEAGRVKEALGRKGTVWAPLKHKVSGEVKKNIEALKIGGIGFEHEERRFYPEASSAAHMLGFVGKNEDGEDQGYFGLEGYYDLVLSGKPGFLSREKDASGLPILLGHEREVSAIEGVELVTNIDKRVQLTLEKKLLEGMQKYGASSASAIVMEPSTGSILAMSSFPSYDPAKYFQFGDSYFKNPVVSDSFEPGSVFKVIVMASALDAGVVEPDTQCDICAGPLKVDKYFIETWNKEYRPDSTMVDVIVHSDNVGMAFVAQRLGAESMYDYLEKFGIGELTGIDLQGEEYPALRQKGTWNIVDLATAGFGQGVAVTPIQLITAVSAIANDGIMVKPQVVGGLKGPGWEEDIKPEVGRRVISKEASDEMTAMMVEAAKGGEAKWTHLRGFKVAGKTGTAQIPIAGHYDAEKTIASFVGFAPADESKFVMLVTMKEPQSSPWASETAAPLWYSIARDLFPYFGIQPEN